MSVGIRNHILMLIEADDEPVRGKTQFMNQMFLICKEVCPELEGSFFPYQFGPYSNKIAKEFNWLKQNEFIEMRKEGNLLIFLLTEKGRLELNQSLISIFDTAMIDIKKSQITRIKRTTHDLGLKKTREYLESVYPEYFINARPA